MLSRWRFAAPPVRQSVHAWWPCQSHGKLVVRLVHLETLIGRRRELTIQVAGHFAAGHEASDPENSQLHFQCRLGDLPQLLM